MKYLKIAADEMRFYGKAFFVSFFHLFTLEVAWNLVLSLNSKLSNENFGASLFERLGAYFVLHTPIVFFTSMVIATLYCIHRDLSKK
ncbi:hypothetical protein [Pseudoxanthomonas winnipegensis]|uniref:Uncharacterized protein n=1 Tax=Pseudoxanthomonas winnipegensis TaxID=2480810 RepID=A0A4Q8M350_9GAMM|nr:hypothetical protein [Pseudoxanthomonas winnipegensis]TAA41531.1 hypothetical protein EA655_11355 [Pseudoxanthomonas winnipegensis]